MLGEGLRAGLAHLGVETRTVCHLEREAYPAAVLAARMQDGSMDAAPVWSDILTFDAAAWLGAVDCVVAGFPCQDLSLAGRRAGLDGKRSGLFFNILDIAHACGARFIFLENVAGIASATASVVDETEGPLDERAAARVLGELADRGWDAEWLTLSAAEVGASHGRERWFCWAWRSVDNPGCLQRRTGHEQDRPGAAEARGHEAHDRATDRGGCAVADSERINCQRRRDAGNMARTGCAVEGKARERKRCGTSADGGSGSVAHASSPRQQGREQCGTCLGNRGGEEAHGPTEQLCRPFFAPGPADAGWAGILREWPNLAPALSVEEWHAAKAAFQASKSGIRGDSDGLAAGPHDSRTARLRACGNGVVALCAAAAVVVLVQRMKEAA